LRQRTSHYAEFCPERTAWLEKTLSQRPDSPTIVTLHHPPCNTGIKWMDGDGDGWAEGLKTVLRKHPQVLRVLVGHVHRAITSECGGRIVSMGPSTGLQVALQIDLNFDIKVDLPECELEQAGFQLLSWDGKRLVGDIAHTEDYERVLPMTREQLDAFLASQHPGPAAEKIYAW